MFPEFQLFKNIRNLPVLLTINFYYEWMNNIIWLEMNYITESRFLMYSQFLSFEKVTNLPVFLKNRISVKKKNQL